jgi:hypothetical protein
MGFLQSFVARPRYSVLLASGKVEPSFYRGNERETLAIMDAEFTFTKEFNIRKNRVKFCSYGTLFIVYGANNHVLIIFSNNNFFLGGEALIFLVK